MNRAILAKNKCRVKTCSAAALGSHNRTRRIADVLNKPLTFKWFRPILCTVVYTNRALGSIFTGKTSAQLWAMVGITPMIGQNDSQGEIFSLNDAQTVLSFAKAHGNHRAVVLVRGP